MLNHYYDNTSELRYFEMNEFGFASPTTMLTLLEEAAAEHCYAIGHDLFKLEAQNIGWVLISGFMQMDRYPNYKEKITIRTWLSQYTTIKGFRENIIYDGQNNIIGRARGLWVFFDIKRRRPVEIFSDIREKWSFCETESIDHNIAQKIPPVQNADHEIHFRVNRYDTDMIQHVNNIRYLQWVVESIPKEIVDHYYLYSIDGRFISEAHLGQTVVSLTIDEPDDSPFKSYLHTIKTNDTGKVCATARTRWKKIGK